MYTREQRKNFIKKVITRLKKAIENKELEAFFFNWSDASKDDKKNSETTINSILPGKWKFFKIYGNGTNIGEGWFYNKKYEIYVSLSCYSYDEDYIDDFEVYKREEVKIP